MAYLEKDEYYIVFVASSRTEVGLKSAASGFDRMLATYRKQCGAA